MTVAGTKDHPITISPIAERVRVVWRGKTIGDTRRALELCEAGYKPVAYLPREDVDMSFLERTDRVTTCPYKGYANYFSIRDAEANDDKRGLDLRTAQGRGRRDRLASCLLSQPGRGSARRLGREWPRQGRALVVFRRRSHCGVCHDEQDPDCFTCMSHARRLRHAYTNSRHGWRCCGRRGHRRSGRSGGRRRGGRGGDSARLCARRRPLSLPLSRPLRQHSLPLVPRVDRV